MRRWVFVFVAAALVPAGTAAQAREEFPVLIARQLGAPHDPACSVCHLGGKTSGATVVTLFAWSMRAHGLGGSPSSVDTAIQGVKADDVDSDGDGAPDWQEIVAGTDPNAPGTAADFSDPQLGCRMAPGRPGWGSAAALAAGLVCFLRRRRR